MRAPSRLVLILSLLGTAQAQPAPVIRWQFVEDRFTLGEPVIVRFSAENLSDETAVVDFGHNFREHLSLRALDPAGAPIAIPMYQPQDLGAVGRVEIRPRERYIRDFVVDDWHHFRLPGRYLIGVSLLTPVNVGAVSLPPPPEFLAPIVIEEHNEVALRRKCESLVAVLNARPIAPKDFEAVASAAAALSHVHDPFVLEYLVRVAVAVPFSAPNIRALYTILTLGTPEALTALRQFATRPDYVGQEARQLLAR